ncbi:MAG: universal stress protein [Myxococcota bacterium]
MTKRAPTLGVAIDTADHPAVVLTHAVAWARHLEGTLLVVTVSDDPADDVALGELADQLPSELRGGVRRLPVPRGADDAGGPDGGTKLSRALGHLDVDLLLVGTHGRQGLSRLLSGSEAEPVVRFSSLPVLVCPLHAAPATAPLVVACPVDPEELDWSAVEWVERHLQGSLHVIAAYPHETAAQHIAGRDLDSDVRHRLERGLDTLGRPSNVTLHGLPGVEGSPAQVLSDTAERLNVDLVALPSHQRHGLARMIYGSVAERIVRQASRAVLVVPMADDLGPS